MASTINPVGHDDAALPVGRRRTATASRRPPGEITIGNFATSAPAGTTGLPPNPANTRVGQNSLDPDLKNDTTDEVIVGVNREIGRGFAVDASYI